MRWNVSGLLKGPVGETREYTETEDLSSIDGVVATAPLAGKIRLTRTNRGILVAAKLGTRVRLTCGRCLRDFEQDIALGFSEEFLETVDMNTGLSIAVDDPEAFTISPDHVLDLDEAVRQYGLLSIPIRALCRAECAGLCPTCGHDLNEGPCGCGAEDVDPRLAKLSQLLEQPPEDEASGKT